MSWSVLLSLAENTYICVRKANIMSKDLILASAFTICHVSTNTDPTFDPFFQQFADEVIEVEEKYDPYDRTISLVPVVKQPRGALRWLGDAIFNGMKNVGAAAGIPDLQSLRQRVSQRRQEFGGGPSATAGALALASRVADGVSDLVAQVPVDKVVQ